MRKIEKHELSRAHEILKNEGLLFELHGVPEGVDFVEWDMYGIDDLGFLCVNSEMPHCPPRWECVGIKL